MVQHRWQQRQGQNNQPKLKMTLELSVKCILSDRKLAVDAWAGIQLRQWLISNLEADH